MAIIGGSWLKKVGGGGFKLSGTYDIELPTGRAL